MKTFLICSIVALVFIGVALTTTFLCWLKAEKKLAKHGESTLYVERVKTQKKRRSKQ